MADTAPTRALAEELYRIAAEYERLAERLLAASHG
jgi:hypothetical protein